MKDILNKISKYFHICKFDKPIVSKYISFNVRDIIFECRCGKRCSRKIYFGYRTKFPIETNLLISNTEFNKILNNLDNELQPRQTII